MERNESSIHPSHHLDVWSHCVEDRLCLPLRRGAKVTVTSLLSVASFTDAAGSFGPLLEWCRGPGPPDIAWRSLWFQTDVDPARPNGSRQAPAGWGQRPGPGAWQSSEPRSAAGSDGSRWTPGSWQEREGRNVNGGETAFCFVSLVLTCSTGRAAPGCCARPGQRYQSYYEKKERREKHYIWEVKQDQTACLGSQGSQKPHILIMRKKVYNFISKINYCL